MAGGVDHGEAEAVEVQGLPVGQIPGLGQAVGQPGGQGLVCRVHPDGDAQLVRQLPGLAAVVEVAVGQQDGRNFPVSRSLQDP